MKAFKLKLEGGDHPDLKMSNQKMQQLLTQMMGHDKILERLRLTRAKLLAQLGLSKEADVEMQSLLEESESNDTLWMSELLTNHAAVQVKRGNYTLAAKEVNAAVEMSSGMSTEGSDEL